jgi:hypothetical protein
MDGSEYAAVDEMVCILPINITQLKFPNPLTAILTRTVNTVMIKGR